MPPVSLPYRSLPRIRYTDNHPAMGNKSSAKGKSNNENPSYGSSFASTKYDVPLSLILKNHTISLVNPPARRMRQADLKSISSHPPCTTSQPIPLCYTFLFQSHLTKNHKGLLTHILCWMDLDRVRPRSTQDLLLRSLPEGIQPDQRIRGAREQL